MDDLDDDVDNKQWARRYILDPLTCPEPNQECGPGSSFRKPLQRAHSIQSRPPPPRPDTLKDPPASAGPTRSSFRQAPLVDRSGHAGISDESHQGRPQQRRTLSRRNSANNSTPKPLSYPPRSRLNRRPSIHTANLPETRWNQGTILTRTSSVSSTHSSKSPETRWNQSTILTRTSSISSSHAPKSPEAPMAPMAPMAPSADTGAVAGPTDGNGLRRAGSLTARFPGDMSHRPLDMIKREHKAANRAPHLPTRHRKQPSDTIDSLDLSGPAPVAYHHDGPYDATMASRNTNKLLSPISAVEGTNREALKATPQEYIQDSLTKHVPLQGTAVVPPGMRDMSGRAMDYKEGADLMREPDAPGGAYKRFDFIPYHADDLKGKGEPSFTIEKDSREQKNQLRKHKASNNADGMAYEMEPRNTRDHKDNRAKIRQRSISNSSQGQAQHATMAMDPDGFSTNHDVRRSNTTGKKLADGLKRRFGSLRRKDKSSQAA